MSMYLDTVMNQLIEKNYATLFSFKKSFFFFFFFSEIDGLYIYIYIYIITMWRRDMTV